MHYVIHFFFSCVLILFYNIILQELLTYDPQVRISAKQAMDHKFFYDVQVFVPPSRAANNNQSNTVLSQSRSLRMM